MSKSCQNLSEMETGFQPMINLLNRRRSRARCLVGIWPAFVFVFSFSFATTGCWSSKSDDDTAVVPRSNAPSRRIVAASYALQYLTQRLVGESVVVEFPAEHSLEPDHWSPGTDEISAMQKADLIVINGKAAEFANWIVQTTLPTSRICESCENIPLKNLIAVPDYQLVHSHGPEGEHSHAYMVPGIWLDPQMALLQTQDIAKRLQTMYPELKLEIETNLNELRTELTSLEKSYSYSDTDRPSVVTTSPEFKYATRAAGVADHHMLWFEKLYEQAPDATVKKLRNLVSDKRASAVIVHPEFPAKLREVCQQENVSIVIVDLLEKKPETGDYLTALKENLRRLSDLRNAPR